MFPPPTLVMLSPVGSRFLIIPPLILAVELPSGRTFPTLPPLILAVLEPPEPSVFISRALMLPPETFSVQLP